MGCLVLLDRLGNIEFPLRYELQKLAICLQLLLINNLTVSFLFLELVLNNLYVNIAFDMSFPHEV